MSIILCTIQCCTCRRTLYQSDLIILLRKSSRYGQIAACIGIQFYLARCAIVVCSGQITQCNIGQFITGSRRSDYIYFRSLTGLNGRYIISADLQHKRITVSLTLLSQIYSIAMRTSSYPTAIISRARILNNHTIYISTVCITCAYLNS